VTGKFPVFPPTNTTLPLNVSFALSRPKPEVATGARRVFIAIEYIITDRLPSLSPGVKIYFSANVFNTKTAATHRPRKHGVTQGGQFNSIDPTFSSGGQRLPFDPLF